MDNRKDAPTILRNRQDEAVVPRAVLARAPHLTHSPDENSNAPKGNWTQLIGSMFNRTAHVFEVPSTQEQDDRFIAEFNARANKSHFNFFFHNCADFSRAVINIYFPNAIHRNYFGDFGLTTPKQVANCLVKYGEGHPETPVTQYRLDQVDGGIARSHRIRGVAESLIKTKRWLVPLLVVQPEVIGVSAIAYFTTVAPGLQTMRRSSRQHRRARPSRMHLPSSHRRPPCLSCPMYLAVLSAHAMRYCSGG